MTAPWPIAKLLPHAAPMLLLDKVLACDAHGLSAAAAVSPSHVFYRPPDGVPAHVGIELMAQACGAYAGAEALRHGEPVKIGFLLGTRDYLAERAWFRDGEDLVVTVTMVFRDEEMGVFDCRIDSAGERVATARLNVYQPGDVAAVLKGRASHG